MITYAPRFRSGWRGSVSKLGLVGLLVAAPFSQAVAANPPVAAKPAAKKAPQPKKKAPPSEWHGEAMPREVVPGAKVLEALLELGSQHMAAGRFEPALKAFTDAANRAPLEPRPLYMRGSCYQKMGKLNEAEADFRDALAKDPKGHDDQTVKVRAELGAVLTDNGHPQEAVPLLEQAAREKPDLFEAHYNLGVAYEQIHEYPKAVESYTRATKLKPVDPNPRANQSDAYYNLGAALRKSGHLEAAIAPTREAVQLAPDKAYTHYNLSLLLSDAKRYDEAVAEMMAAIQLSDANLRSATTQDEKDESKQLLYKAWWRLGVMHIRREAASDAVGALERAKQLQATPEVLTDLGLALRKANNIPRAEAEFRAALQLNPNLNAARLHLASLLATTGRCPEGLQQLNSVSSDPAYAEAVNGIKQRCAYEKMAQPQPTLPRKK
jgi:tetratricopeptide (TPR) repeat protein